MSSAPSPAPCSKKKELFASIYEAVDRIRAISDEQLHVLADYDFKRLDRLREEMTKVRDRKTALLKEFDEHIMSHGC